MRMNFRVSVFFVFLSFANFVFSQRVQYSSSNKKIIELYNQALSKFDLRYFDQAMPLLNKAIKKEPSFVEAYEVKSVIYALQTKYLEAIGVLEEGLALNPSHIPRLHCDLAEFYFKTQQYEKGKAKAQEYLNKYQPKSKLRWKANYVLESCKFSMEAIKNPDKIIPLNLGPNINSELREYLPVLSVDMSTLIYTRTIPDDRNHDGFQEDFYAAFKHGKDWRKSFNIGAPLNTEVNEGGHSLTPDGNAMFFTICDQYGFYGKGRVGHGSCDIFVTFLLNGKWSNPKNLGPKLNHRAHDAQPSMSSDGRTLYFSSTRPGGYGENDIYVAKLTSTGWSTPRNLGGTINTPGREEGVFIHPDGQTLYFSSDGHPGLGDNDIFMSKKQFDGSWSKPINLGFPINTPKDEFDFTVDAMGNYAYMTSDREGGFGDWDIYKFKLPKEFKPKPVTYMKGRVYDAKTNAPLSAHFELIELEKGKKIVESTANGSGRFLVCLPFGKEYALNASHEGYLFYSENFELQKASNLKPVERDVPLQPIQVGERIVLENIFFLTDAYNLESESEVELNKLKEYLENNPLLKIEIGGHTDNQGGKEHNLALSKNRARSVYEWLVMHKIDKERLSYVGYADEWPIADNSSPEGRAKNRRTEVKIMGK